MLRVVVFILFFISSIQVTKAGENSISRTTLDVLTNARLAGMCGAMFEITKFAQKKKLPGGNNFVIAFWIEEAAKFGVTPQQMKARCSSSIDSYSATWKLINNETKK